MDTPANALMVSFSMARRALTWTNARVPSAIKTHLVKTLMAAFCAHATRASLAMASNAPISTSATLKTSAMRMQLARTLTADTAASAKADLSEMERLAKMSTNV